MTPEFETTLTQLRRALSRARKFARRSLYVSECKTEAGLVLVATCGCLAWPKTRAQPTKRGIDVHRRKSTVAPWGHWLVGESHTARPKTVTREALALLLAVKSEPPRRRVAPLFGRACDHVVYLYPQKYRGL